MTDSKQTPKPFNGRSDKFITDHTAFWLGAAIAIIVTSPIISVTLVALATKAVQLLT